MGETGGISVLFIHHRLNDVDQCVMLGGQGKVSCVLRRESGRK